VSTLELLVTPVPAVEHESLCCCGQIQLERVVAVAAAYLTVQYFVRVVD
jgi:hypothetical protein